MKYDEATEWIEKRRVVMGSVPGLDSIKAFLTLLGNPEQSIPMIHICGTNGKGSTSVYIESILREAGLKVGRFSSPAVVDRLEIITVNGRNISRADYADLIEELRLKVDESQIPVTSFEIETALAFIYFIRKKCDVVIMECGMGGALDATNVVKNPLLNVFVSISMDHMNYLGETIEEIAEQKAGIITDGSVNVSIEQDDNVRRVLTQRAAWCNAKINFVEKNEIKVHKTGIKGTVFTYGSLKKITTQMLGVFQPENASLAILAAVKIREKGYKISDEQIRRGIGKASWPCRFEVVSVKPTVVLDGAHNEDAAKRMKENLEIYFTNRPLIFIMGILKDKEYKKIIEETSSKAAHIITVPCPNKGRTLSSFELADAVREINTNVTAADSVAEGLELAMLLAANKADIVAFGSLSFLGEIRKEVKRIQKNGR